MQWLADQNQTVLVGLNLSLTFAHYKRRKVPGGRHVGMVFDQRFFRVGFK